MDSSGTRSTTFLDEKLYASKDYDWICFANLICACTIDVPLGPTNPKWTHRESNPNLVSASDASYH